VCVFSGCAGKEASKRARIGMLEFDCFEFCGWVLDWLTDCWRHDAGVKLTRTNDFFVNVLA
jgi:hypothetical protein